MPKKLLILGFGLLLPFASWQEVRAQDSSLFRRIDDALFDGDYHIPIAGYYHTSAYPVGFYSGIVTRVPVRVGWNCNPDKDNVSESEYREPTWTLNLSMLIGRCFAFNGGYALLFGGDIGVDFVRKSHVDPVTSQVLEKKTVPYFSCTPKLGISVGLIDFLIGYEWVPAYSRLSGWTFGVGVSVPTH